MLNVYLKAILLINNKIQFKKDLMEVMDACHIGIIRIHLKAIALNF